MLGRIVTFRAGDWTQQGETTKALPPAARSRAAPQTIFFLRRVQRGDGDGG
jgi:hypothetical protein